MGDKTLNERVLDLEQSLSGLTVPKPVLPVDYSKEFEKLYELVGLLAESHNELIELLKGSLAETQNAGRSRRGQGPQVRKGWVPPHG